MSILITGIDMPTKGNPITVSIYPDGTAEWEAQNKKGTAVPVPPHGRLGDLDELEGDFREDAKGPWNMRAMPMNWADAFEEVADIIADAPTIIPAEETLKEATNDQNNS